MKRVATWLLALIGALALVGTLALAWAVWVWFTTMPWVLE